jgi:tetratricopeptide (TPR) repeat protein
MQLQTNVLRAKPRDPGVRSEMALIQDELGMVMVRQNRLPEALEFCSQALAIRAELAAAAPSVAVHRESLARSRHNLGVILAKSDHIEQAVVSYREGVRLRKKLVEDFPKNAVYRDQLATSCKSLGFRLLKSESQTETIETFRLGLQAAPNDARMLNELAWILTTCNELALREPVGALELARRATQLEPEGPDYWNTLGAASYRAGKSQAAVHALHKAMQLRGDGGKCIDWFFIALAHWQLGQQDEACRWHRQAIEWLDQNGPPNAELLRIRNEVDAMLSEAK